MFTKTIMSQPRKEAAQFGLLQRLLKITSNIAKKLMAGVVDELRHLEDLTLNLQMIDLRVKSIDLSLYIWKLSPSFFQGNTFIWDQT
jgi:hypothetical protein